MDSWVSFRSSLDFDADSFYSGLNVQAAAKVATALERISDGNLSNVKSVGGGVLEFKIDFGPGYRIYNGRDGERFVILLAGGQLAGL